MLAVIMKSLCSWDKSVFQLELGYTNCYSSWVVPYLVSSSRSVIEL